MWEALNDAEVLRACIPGCQSLQKEADDRFTAVAEVKIGPIGARFKGAVALSDLDRPNGYTISGSGSGGVAGNAKGMAKVRLSPDGAGTMLAYQVEAQVGGRMAQLGGPLIDATAGNLAEKFFSKFGEVVGGVAAPRAAAVATPVAGAAATSEVAASAPVASFASCAGRHFPLGLGHCAGSGDHRGLPAGSQRGGRLVGDRRGVAGAGRSRRGL